MTDFLQNLGTIGCLGAEREAFATQLSATHTTRKSHVFAGTCKARFMARAYGELHVLRTVWKPFYLHFCFSQIVSLRTKHCISHPQRVFKQER